MNEIKSKADAVAIITESHVTSELAAVGPTEAAIQELKEKYLSLTINGINDKINYEKAFDGEKEISKLINKVDKKRLEINANNKKLVDSAALKIVEELQPIMKHLSEQVVSIDNENARIAKEKAESEERERNKAINEEKARLAEKEAELNRKQAQLEELAKSLGVELKQTLESADKTKASMSDDPYGTLRAKVTEALNTMEPKNSINPDVEVLVSWANRVANAKLPPVDTDKGQRLLEKVKGMLTRLSEFVVTETGKF